MIHEHVFRGVAYRTITGRTHPQYSIDCFDGDEAEFRDKYWTPKQGDTVLDVGASYGAYTLTAMVHGARVYAFEPELTVYRDLCTNMDMNQMAPASTFPFGLSDKTETIDAKTYAPHWPAQTITHDYVMMRMDDVAAPRHVDWIKIDVEGMEEKVLRGGQETIRMCRPRVLCECHTFMDKQLVDKCKELLPGYSFEVISQRIGETHMLVATP